MSDEITLADWERTHGMFLDFKLHYTGRDLVGKIEGTRIGPNTIGEFFVIEWVTYDGRRSTAWCRYAQEKDFTPLELQVMRGEQRIRR